LQKTYEIEYRCKRHDGEWRWLLGQARPLLRPDGSISSWLGTCTDINDLVEARRAAEQTREQLLRVIEHAKVTLWAVNRKKQLTLLEGNLMWQGSDFDMKKNRIGQDVYQFLSHFNDAAGVQQHKQIIEAILTRKSTDETLTFERRVDGKSRWLRTRFVALLPQTRNKVYAADLEIRGVIGVSMDVTGKYHLSSTLVAARIGHLRATVPNILNAKAPISTVNGS
jgi:hypothetical protein